ncbi:MHS family MFS transporter [Pseudonocardia sp. MCCB 268]|nr:MHS family MFS transporter [Pseudonocardia cytotoxica]
MPQPRLPEPVRTVQRGLFMSWGPAAPPWLSVLPLATGAVIRLWIVELPAFSPAVEEAAPGMPALEVPELPPAPDRPGGARLRLAPA